MLSALAGRLRKTFAPPDVAIDLGTAHTRVISAGGAVTEERSQIFPEWRRDARPASLCPMRRGFIHDIEAASAILEPMIRRAVGGCLRAPRALACLPSNAGEAEREILMRVARTAGARTVAVTSEPLAAAIGSGVDIASPWAQILVDVGEGVTDLAVIRGGRPIYSATLDIACVDLRERIVRAVETSEHVQLTEREAERLLRLACSVTGDAASQTIWLSEGRDVLTGQSAAICVSADLVLEAVDPLLARIADFARGTVQSLPASVGVEVIENGIWLAGGGATLHRLARRVRRATQLDVHRAADPLHAVITGAGKMLSVGDAASLWMR